MTALETVATVSRAKRNSDSVTSLVDDISSDEAFMYDFSSSTKFRPGVPTNKNFILKAATRFVSRQSIKIAYEYLKDPDREPLAFDTHKDAIAHVESLRDLFIHEDAREHNTVPKRKYVTLTEAVNILLESRLAMTAMPNTIMETSALLVYNYDRQMYEAGTSILSSYVVNLCGIVNRSMVDSVASSLVSNSHRLAIYNPLPPWQLPVSNGVLNLITHTLVPNTPIITVQRRIDTPYIPEAVEPEFMNGMSFDKLMNDLANHNPRRLRLLKQILKTVILGHAPDATLFDIVGRGGDGKSLMMELIAHVIGLQNVAHLNLSELSDDNLLYRAVSAWLILGPDNSLGRLSKDAVSRAKQISSMDLITINRKYMEALTFRPNGISVQLWNAPPRYGESSSAIYRRVVTFYAENSHYENGTMDKSLKTLIKDPSWHIYILKYLIDDVPYFSDYEDIDRHIMVDTLTADDPMTSFIEDLDDAGILSHAALHRSLLYGAYLDWMDRNMPDAKKINARSFGIQIPTMLKPYGYKVDTDQSRYSVRRFLDQYNVNASIDFRGLTTGENFRKALESGSKSNLLFREEGFERPKLDRRGRRTSEDCTVFEYFDIMQYIAEDVRIHSSAYQDLLDELAELAKPSEKSAMTQEFQYGLAPLGPYVLPSAEDLEIMGSVFAESLDSMEREGRLGQRRHRRTDDEVNDEDTSSSHKIKSKSSKSSNEPPESEPQSQARPDNQGSHLRVIENVINFENYVPLDELTDSDYARIESGNKALLLKMMRESRDPMKQSQFMEEMIPVILDTFDIAPIDRDILSVSGFDDIPMRLHTVIQALEGAD